MYFIQPLGSIHYPRNVFIWSSVEAVILAGIEPLARSPVGSAYVLVAVGVGAGVKVRLRWCIAVYSNVLALSSSESC